MSCRSPRTPGAQGGSCERGGYPRFEREERMQPSGFPMKVNVRIYQSPFACHCHSYEEIKCGAEGDDLCHKLSQPSTRWRN